MPFVLENLKMTKLDAPATGAGFAGDALVVADGDGKAHFCSSDGEVLTFKAHDGAILALATNEKTGHAYSAGDDGRVLRLALDEEAQVLHEGRKWVDAIAVSARGAVAWSTGKSIHLAQKPGDEPVTVDAPSSVSALAFSVDGRWLGAAVYGGALLVSPANPDKRTMLEWKGSHLTIGFSPDGRFCVTSMLENALHVWRIDKPEDKHGRMGGYPAKPASFAWSADGRVMATAGADQLVMWPFTGADGPLGQGAQVFDNGASIIRSVASRPQSRQFALGYADGSVAVADRKDEAHYPIAAKGETESPVAHLCFSADGRTLGFAREDGTIGLAKLGKA